MENKKLEEGKKYLSGYINLGILGKDIKVAFFPNDDKKKETEPDYKSADGALWVNTKKKIVPKIDEEKTN